MANLQRPKEIIAVTPMMDKCMHDFKFSKEANVITLRDRSFVGLAAVDLLQQRYVHATRCLPHPRNRDGKVLIYQNVNPHTEDVLNQGFTWTQTECASGFEIDEADRAYIESNSMEITVASNGVIPRQSQAKQNWQWRCARTLRRAFGTFRWARLAPSSRSAWTAV